MVQSSNRDTKEMPTWEAQRVRYLLLATDDRMHGRHSGYTRLADEIQQSMLITAQRTDPRKFVDRGAVRLINCFTMTSWYRLGSLKVEWRAWRLVQAGFRGLVHFMWAERDWGFFDHLPVSAKPALCATFHACPDTLPEVVRNTNRLKNLAAVILMSEVQRPFFEARGIPAERIHVIHHGIDCQYFSPTHRENPRDFTVLFVGSFRRNFPLLRKVCAMLEPFNDIRIKIIAPQSRICAFRDAKNVITVSNVSDDDLRASYREASCLLMTLESATANNAVVEAMACGLPIVAENIGGIAEYTGGRCAMLCEPGSAETLTQSILTLRKDPNVIASMSLLARERAKELDWPLVAERTVRLYENVLASHV